MAFRVGQKVVCVDAESAPLRAPLADLALIKKGAVYMITEMRIDPSSGAFVVRIDAAFSERHWFQARRFRPVVSTTTGMAILEQIRRDVTNKELRPIWEDEQV